MSVRIQSICCHYDVELYYAVVVMSLFPHFYSGLISQVIVSNIDQPTKGLIAYLFYYSLVYN